MYFLTDKHLNGSRSKHSIRRHIPSASSQQCMPRGGERREIRGRSARDDPAFAIRPQSEYLADLSQHHFFDFGRHR